MATALNPPNSKAVVQVSDESVDKFTALGWKPVKQAKSSRKVDSSDDKK